MSSFIAVLIIVTTALQTSALLTDEEVIPLWSILQKRFAEIDQMIRPVTEDNVQAIVEEEAEKCKEINTGRDEISQMTDEVSLLKPKVNRTIDLESAFRECVNNIAEEYFVGVTHVGISRVIFEHKADRHASRNAVHQKETIVQFLIMLVKAPKGKRGVLQNVPLDQEVLTSIRQRMLTFHNVVREDHGSKELKLDPELNEIAQDYALALADGEKLVHSASAINRAHGENIANYGRVKQHNMGAGDADFASKDWYNNIKYYNFETPDFTLETKWGTFTAMIWDGTDRIGVGVAYSTVRTNTGLIVHWIWVVAKYLETPNNPNHLLTNVFPLK